MRGEFDVSDASRPSLPCVNTRPRVHPRTDDSPTIRPFNRRPTQGCGTVMDIEDCKAAMDAGSEFLVAPCLVPEVVTWCRMHNIPIFPGCQTPSEAYAAYKAGAPVQKIFPGVAGGPMWVKAVSAAMPMLRLNPTSGVDLDNAAEFLQNGANSVGLVAPLFPPGAIAAEDWDQVQANAAKVIGSIRDAGIIA